VTGRERAKRKVVGFKDLPKHLIDAVTTTEDRSFFQHYGVNFRGIIRALLRRYNSDPNSPIAQQGGSGITRPKKLSGENYPKPTCQSSSKRD
jgi:penicillin-binding protein 1B